jgi:hypothetical protein
MQNVQRQAKYRREKVRKIHALPEHDFFDIAKFLLVAKENKKDKQRRIDVALIFSGNIQHTATTQ